MYPPHHLGGYELACRDAVVRWRARGHDVAVLTSDVTFPHADADDDPSVVRRLRMYWRDNVILTPRLIPCLGIERHNLRHLRKALEEHRPDVVSIWHMGALSLGLITEISHQRVPIVIVIGDQWLVYGPHVDAWMRRFTSRSLLRAVVGRLTDTRTTVEIGSDAAVLFASDWLRRRTEERSLVTLPERRAVVYGGIDHEVFRPHDGRSFSWRLLYAGRVETRKGVHVAVDAMAHLPAQATLDIVGSWDDDAYVDDLRSRADRLGIRERVRLHGQVPRQDLAKRIAESDVFIFPVVWEEPFGMAPLEAMACGTPVVGTATGGSAEFLVDGVNSLHAAPDDSVELARHVRTLAGDSMLRGRLIEAGLRTAASFTNHRYNDELEAWHVAVSKRFAEGLPPSADRGDAGAAPPRVPPAIQDDTFDV